MFILVFFIITGLVTFAINKQKDISENNMNSYSMNKTGTLSMLILIASAIVLQLIVPRFFIGIMPIMLGIYSVACLTVLVVNNTIRIQQIQKERDQIVEIYEILNLLIQPGKDGIDFNDIPFELTYDPKDRSKISRISIKMENPDKFKDSATTQSVYNLNKFLPYKTWMVNVDYPERLCEFIGENHPPKMAHWPGSDLRPFNWMPLGLNAHGELGWNLGASSKTIGESMYTYEDNTVAETVDVSKAPQALALGSTGGGKAIVMDEVVDVV